MLDVQHGFFIEYGTMGLRTCGMIRGNFGSRLGSIHSGEIAWRHLGMIDGDVNIRYRQPYASMLVPFVLNPSKVLVLRTPIYVVGPPERLSWYYADLINAQCVR